MFAELISLLYPANCLHCHVEIDNLTHFLCRYCSSYLCFTEVNQTKHCSIFAREGPAVSLWQYFEKKQPQKLLKLIVSFFVVHYSQMNWPTPRFISYLPENKVYLFKNNSVLKSVAKELAKALSIPFKEVMYRSIQDQVFDASGKACTLLKPKKNLHGSYPTLVVSKAPEQDPLLIQAKNLYLISYFDAL